MYFSRANPRSLISYHQQQSQTVSSGASATQRLQQHQLKIFSRFRDKNFFSLDFAEIA